MRESIARIWSLLAHLAMEDGQFGRENEREREKGWRRVRGKREGKVAE